MKLIKTSITAARAGKTKEIIVLQGNYGYGWDDLVEYEQSQYSEARQDLKDYRENERNAQHRLVTRRIPNPDWVAPTDRYSVLVYDFGFTRKVSKPTKFSDVDEAIAYATQLCDSGSEVVLKDIVTGCNVQLIPGDEYRTNKNLNYFRETVSDDTEVVKSSTQPKRKFTIEASEQARHKRVVNYKDEWLDALLSKDNSNKCGMVYKDGEFYAEYSLNIAMEVAEEIGGEVVDSDTGEVLIQYEGASAVTTATDTNTTIEASADGPLQVCEHCLWAIESREGRQVVYDTLEYYSWDEDAEPLICDWCEEEVDILYQITPDDVEASVSTRKSEITATSSKLAKQRIDREDFATNLINNLESEYSIKVSNDAWGKIVDLAHDLDFGANADKHGATPQDVLEQAIYDIIEDDTGVIIGADTVQGTTTIEASKYTDNFDRIELAGSLVYEWEDVHGCEVSEEAWSRIQDIAMDSDIDIDLLPEYVGYILSEDEQSVLSAKCTTGSKVWVESHPHYPDTYILHDTATGGTMKVGTKQEIVDFCKEKLAASVPNIDELERMIDDANRTSNIVTAAIGAPNNVDDVEYYEALAANVVEQANRYFTVKGLVDIVYDISDTAITFTDTAYGNNDVVYIQPLENITPNWDDLESDATELYETIMGELLPKF